MFVAGWCVNVLAWPVNFLSANIQAAANWIVMFAVGFSLVIAISMLFERGNRAASSEGQSVC